MSTFPELFIYDLKYSTYSTYSTHPSLLPPRPFTIEIELPTIIKENKENKEIKLNKYCSKCIK